MAPERRASLSPMAIACLRFLTLRRPPDFKPPCLYSCITLPTLSCALRPYLRRLPELVEVEVEGDRRERVDFFAEVREVLPWVAPRDELERPLRALVDFLRVVEPLPDRRLPERVELLRLLEDFRAVAIISSLPS